MIGRLTGTLLEKNPPQILVDVHGVGYELDVPMSTFYGLPAAGSQVSLHTHFAVREDGHFLYGFATEHERAKLAYDVVIACHERAGAAWTMYLVPAHGDQVGAPGVGVERNLAKRLHCIDMQQRTRLAAMGVDASQHVANLCQWLDDACFVVDGLDGNEVHGPGEPEILPVGLRQLLVGADGQANDVGEAGMGTHCRRDGVRHPPPPRTEAAAPGPQAFRRSRPADARAGTDAPGECPLLDVEAAGIAGRAGQPQAERANQAEPGLEQWVVDQRGEDGVEIPLGRRFSSSERSCRHPTR